MHSSDLRVRILATGLATYPDVTVVCGPYLDFETVTDNQVVTMRLGSAPEWSTASGSNDVWARMGKTIDDEWDGSGIRLRVTLGSVEISAWEDFEQLWARKKKIFGMVPHKDMEFTLVAGYIGDERLFKVMKDGGEVFAYKETEGTSLVGAGQRGVGSGEGDSAHGHLVQQPLRQSESPESLSQPPCPVRVGACWSGETRRLWQRTRRKRLI